MTFFTFHTLGYELSNGQLPIDSRIQLAQVSLYIWIQKWQYSLFHPYKIEVIIITPKECKQTTCIAQLLNIIPILSCSQRSEVWLYYSGFAEIIHHNSNISCHPKSTLRYWNGKYPWLVISKNTATNLILLYTHKWNQSFISQSHFTSAFWKIVQWFPAFVVHLRCLSSTLYVFPCTLRIMPH